MSTILIVDDMAVFREPIAAALRSMGYQTLCAADGREALDMARTKDPNLILLDMAVPVMDGKAFLKARSADPHLRDIPVIALTVVTDRDCVLDARKLGIRDYVLKSQFSLDELQRRLRKYVGEAKVGPDTPSGNGSQEFEADSQGESADHAKVESIAPDASDDGTPRTSTAPTSVANISLEEVQTLKDLKPLMKRSDIQGRLDHCGELKGFSPTVARLLDMTRKKDCSIEKVVKTVKQDHAIALKIMKMANSVVYSRGEPVESVQKAVMRIGLSQIRQAVMNISVIEHFSQDQNKYLTMPQFWEHSIGCGLIAAEVTRSLEGSDAQIDAAFTMGLLHDTARLVYAETLGDQYTRAFEAAEQLQLPMEQVESRLFLVNHADAMDRVLHSWKFPKELINPIALHHLSIGNIRQVAPHVVNEVATLALANRLAHALLLGSSGNRVIYPLDELATALKLDKPLFDRLVEEVPDQTTDVKMSMLAGSKETDWTQVRDEIRDSLGEVVRPIHVSAKPEFDAFRIFCDSLREIDEDEDENEQQPNVGIIYMSHVRERAPLTANFLELEKAAGAKVLPVIVASPNGNLQLEERVMGGRRFELLPVPVCVSRFVDALSALVSSKPASKAA